MVAEDLELTVETLRCKEDKEASGLVKKVELQYTGSLKKVMNRILRAMLGDQIFRLKWPKVVQSGPNWQKQSKNSLNGPKWSKNIV